MITTGKTCENMSFIYSNSKLQILELCSHLLVKVIICYF